MRVKLNRKFETSPGTVFHDCVWKWNNHMCMIAVGWSSTKGDWWWKDSPSDKRLFWFSKDEGKILTRWGVYFGRLAITFMRSI
ncbi:hypothetical protein P9578_28300 [Brevibacillus choshinensis]|uniref:hypothetical protein n=1 Tax=Brevibacillus choshinensis TaxID=54911 RepID=UPI002E1CA2AA|nr:hypothetical protein [Brevibacillus choshinensis]